MKKAPRAFDPRAGESAFNELEPTLRALSSEEVASPNSDPQDSAVAALALVDIARDPKRKARLALLSAELIAKNAVEMLESAAWATWFAHTRVLSEAAGTTGAKVDVALYERSGQLLAKMIKVLDYHVGGEEDVAAEIADIRSGTGYQDRASDLVRVATLWERWRSEIADDTRFFDANDAKQARSYAEKIVQALRASMQGSLAEWTDLRNRAWTLLSRYYNEVRAAGEFVFRSDVGERNLFIPLRQAVNPTRARANAPEPPAAPGAPSNAGNAH